MTYRFVSDTALRVGQFALLIEAVVRGLNYLATPPRSSDALSQLELSAPLWVWGYTFIVFGVIGLFGEALLSGTQSNGSYNPRAWPSFIAHGALMFLFMAIAVGTAVGIAERQPVYGFVSPYDLLAFAVGHWMFARRRKHAR